MPFSPPVLPLIFQSTTVIMYWRNSQYLMTLMKSTLVHAGLPKLLDVWSSILMHTKCHWLMLTGHVKQKQDSRWRIKEKSLNISCWLNEFSLYSHPMQSKYACTPDEIHATVLSQPSCQIPQHFLWYLYTLSALSEQVVTRFISYLALCSNWPTCSYSRS